MENLIAEVSICPHGCSFCPFHEIDKDICVACLKDVIKFYKKELKKVQDEGQDI